MNKWQYGRCHNSLMNSFRLLFSDVCTDIIALGGIQPLIYLLGQSDVETSQLELTVYLLSNIVENKGKFSRHVFKIKAFSKHMIVLAYNYYKHNHHFFKCKI